MRGAFYLCNLSGMRTPLLILALAFLPSSVLADTVIASLGDIAVTTEDFEAELARMPPDVRFDFRSNPQRIAKAVENLLVTRSLAASARSNGIERDQQAAREIQLSTEKILARRERERLEATIQVPDFSKRAEEIYKTNRDRYAIQPRYRTQHLLVALKCRTRDEGLARATLARNEITSGVSFEEVVSRYSDDPSAAQNKGDLGFMSVDSVAAEYAEAMQKLKPGEVSKPTLTQFGWHVIKLVESKPPVPYRFEEVRESIIGELRGEYIRTKNEEFVSKIRSDPAIKINTEILDGLIATTKPGATAKPATPR